MRSTEIKGMQLSHQKTPGPGHSNPQVSSSGTKFGFQIQSKNQKCFNQGQCLDRQERFYQYNQWARVTGRFLGPSDYEDESAWNKLRAQPCPTAIHKPIFGAHGSLAGQKCYVAQGHLIKYEPTLVKSKERKAQKKLKINLTYQLEKMPATYEALNSKQISLLSKKKGKSKIRNTESMSVLHPFQQKSENNAS